MPSFTRLRASEPPFFEWAKKHGPKKAHPTAAVYGLLSYDFAKLLRGSLTVHPCTGSKLARIPASHPAGFSYAPLPLLRGPIERASCAAKPEQQQEQQPVSANCCYSFLLPLAGEGARQGG